MRTFLDPLETTTSNGEKGIDFYFCLVEFNLKFKVDQVKGGP